MRDGAALYTVLSPWDAPDDDVEVSSLTTVQPQQRPGSQAALGHANRRRIERILQSGGAMTQADLARESGLAPATVSNIVRRLKASGAIRIEHVSGSHRRVVRLAPSSEIVAGFDYGHRHLSVALADRGHQVLAERRVDLGAGLSAEESLDIGAALLQETLDEAGADRSDIKAAGMGLPAPINDASGQVGALSILPGWVGVNAAHLATQRLGVPVFVDNEANLGAWAEYLWGAGRDVQNLAFVKLSEGVGAGLIVDGRLFRGRDGTSGEVGHTTLDEMGAVCRCGNRGCLETVISARSVLELLQPRFGADFTIADVVYQARTGDAACIRVLSDTGRQAGLALANLCNVFNPERILIGGELAQAGDLLLGSMRESIRRFGIPSATAGLEIQIGDLGARAILLGTVALALHQLAAADQ